MMTLGRAALKRKSSCVLRPIAAPIENIVVGKVVPGRLSLDGRGLKVRVVPNQRPKIFRVNLIESFQPRSHTLRLGALEALRQAIEQIVIGMKMPLRMSAWILLALAGARQRSFEDIAKIKNVIATRQHRVRNVLMHQTKPGAVVKVFAGRVCVGVKIMDQPRGREDPILKTFVVITILRIRR